MSAKDLFSDLPAVLVCDIIGKWLNPKVVAKLDSALCNRSARNCYTKLFDLKECSIKSTVDLREKELVVWLDKRKLRTTSVLLGETFPELEDYLRWSDVMCTNDMAMETTGFFPRNLQSLTCADQAVGCNLKLVLWFNPNLRELSFHSVTGFDPLFFHNVELPQRRELHFYRTDLTDALHGHITRTTDLLQKIELCCNYFISDEGITVVAQRCCLLHSVSLKSTPMIGNGALTLLTELCPHIVHLNVRGSCMLTDSGVQNLRGLRSIGIAYCIQLSDVSLQHLTKFNAGTLDPLHMEGLECVHRKVFARLLRKCTLLRTLTLDCDLNTHFASIVPFMSGLHSLTIFSLVSDEVLSMIAEHCQDLHTLGLFSTRKVTADGSETTSVTYSDGSDHSHHDTQEEMRCAEEEASWDDQPRYTHKGLFPSEAAGRQRRWISRERAYGGISADAMAAPASTAYVYLQYGTFQL